MPTTSALHTTVTGGALLEGIPLAEADTEQVTTSWAHFWVSFAAPTEERLLHCLTRMESLVCNKDSRDTSTTS